MDDTIINTSENFTEKNVADLIRFRSPSNQELQQIKRYMMRKYKRMIKSSEQSCNVCLVAVAISMLIPFFRLVIVCIFGFSLLAMQKVRKEMQKRLSLWTVRNFKVLDGTIISIEGNPDDPEMVNVQFQANYGEVLKDSYKMQMENVSKGSPVLLAYIQEDEQSSLFEIFTPEMLADMDAKHSENTIQ